ncbi:MAG TPA: response regulator [Aggregatilineales bacterium]|nr:response regulator [Aggregatilineales bacterium]
MATVMILEDNPEIAALYERIFGSHQINIVGDIPDAIGYLRRTRPDLVIMDFHLPSGTGVDVLNFMRARPGLKDVPVLGVSVDDELKEEAQASGMNAFLTKPIEVLDLIKTAQKLITSSPQRRAPSADLRAALDEYAVAYQAVYHRMPKGRWTGSKVLIDGHECDERWLRGEAARLRGLVERGDPRKYLQRLLEKIRLL